MMIFLMWFFFFFFKHTFCFNKTPIVPYRTKLFGLGMLNELNLTSTLREEWFPHGFTCP